MKIVGIFSHRNGKDILESPKFCSAFNEFLSVLRDLPPFRTEKPKRLAQYIISPTAMNNWLDNELCIKRDWDWQPLIINADPDSPKAQSQLKSDYRKARIEVEVQFGNVARYAYDLYKMAISLAMEQADVGIQVVCSKRFAGIMGDNLAYYERAVRELERSRLTLIVPLVVIGVEPERWLIDAYPAEITSPRVTRRMINSVRLRRGAPPVEEVEAQQGALTVGALRRLLARIA